MRPLSEFDPAWPQGHVTRDGRTARIMGRIKSKPFPLIIVIENKNGSEIIDEYTDDGRFWDGEGIHDGDLVNAPAPKKRIKGWVNLYEGSVGGGLYTAREDADKYGTTRLACIYIDVEEGEGLS